MKLFLFFLAISSNVFAHQNSVTDSGKKIFVPDPVIGLELKNNPTDISLGQTTSIIQETLQQWNLAQTNLKLSLSSSNLLFQIQFDHNFDRYGAAVVGLTEMSYNKDGHIQKAIIRLNNNVSLSASKSAHIGNGIFLGDVLSHEIGHMVGLHHSEVLESTMFFESFPGQQTLSKDDTAGVRSLYSTGHGVISGTVMGGQHIPVLGAQVKAISRLSGESISTVSDENGKFYIRGLDLNDSYYLYVSPTVKVNDLPPYYANTQKNFCPGAYKGGFFTGCGVEEAGSAQVISLSTNMRAVDVGVVSISCDLRSSPEYAQTKVDEDPEPILLWDSFSEQVNEKNQIGYFAKTTDWSKWDKFHIDLRNISNLEANKKVRIGLVNYPFGNLLEYQMKIYQGDNEWTMLGMSEDYITQTYSNNLFVDVPLSVYTGLNEFTIHIRARSLSNDCFEGYCGRWTFPAMDLLNSNDQFPYLLTLGLSAAGQPLFNTEQLLSDNSSCLQGPFTYAVERNVVHHDDPPQKKAEGQMSCGTIEPSSGSGSPPQQGLFSLTLGFMLAYLSMLFKKDKKTLS